MAMKFTKANEERIYVPDHTSLRPSIFTLCCWYWQNAGAADDFRTPVGKQYGEDDLNSYQLVSQLTTRKLYAVTAIGGVAKILYSDQVLPEDAWSFIAQRYTGSEHNVWYNDQQVVSNPESGSISYDSNPVDIGADDESVDDWRYFVDGFVDDVRLYDYDLTDEELLTIRWSGGADGIVNGLRARWMFHERAPGVSASGAGSVLDLSEYKNHGTPVNTPTYAESELRAARPAA